MNADIVIRNIKLSILTDTKLEGEYLKIFEHLKCMFDNLKICKSKTHKNILHYKDENGKVRMERFENGYIEIGIDYTDFNDLEVMTYMSELACWYVKEYVYRNEDIIYHSTNIKNIPLFK